jgi:hypothetical protein
MRVTAFGFDAVRRGGDPKAVPYHVTESSVILESPSSKGGTVCVTSRIIWHRTLLAIWHNREPLTKALWTYWHGWIRSIHEGKQAGSGS